jgi:hypothetical protein
MAAAGTTRRTLLHVLVLVHELLVGCSAVPPDAPRAILETMSRAADDGIGERPTVIEGRLQRQSDVFLLPVRGEIVQLWGPNDVSRASHTDFEGRFVFTEMLQQGAYVIGPESCRATQVRLLIGYQRKFDVDLQMTGSCSPRNAASAN